VNKMGVAKGEEIYVGQNEDGSLLLSLKKEERGLKQCIIEAAAFDASMRNIVSAYVGGASTIVLRGKETNTLAEEARRILSGVEISEESGNELVLKVLSYEAISLDGTTRRAFNVTKSMFELAVSQYRDGTDVQVEMARKEDEVDRLYLLLLRSFCLYNQPARQAVFKAIAAKSMEKISDHLEDICTSGKPLGPNALVANLIEKALVTYASAYTSFSSNSINAAEFAAAKDSYFKDFKKIDELLKKEKNTGKMLALKSLSEKCTKIIRYSEDILESGGDLIFANMEAEQQQNKHLNTQPSNK
ncbi:MAG: PhoU domain-containing protein, partial [Candidatus Micrarchaeota archaeon]